MYVVPPVPYGLVDPGLGETVVEIGGRGEGGRLVGVYPDRLHLPSHLGLEPAPLRSPVAHVP